jgi:pyruvate,water dikinase
MVPLFWLDQIESRDKLQVGEQALHLSLLAKQHYPVIPTVIIPANHFREFLGTIHLLDPFFSDLPNSSLRLNVEDPKQLQSIARQIRQTVEQTTLSSDLLASLTEAIDTFPALGSGAQAVILRSSLALKSLDTAHTPLTLSTEITSLIEPQISWTDSASLESALKQLWTELFRARNLVYWQRASLSVQQLHFAVLVQPIASAIASGSLQSTATDWELLATSGLEFAIVQGEVLPELIRIEPDTETLHTQKRGHQTIAYGIASGVSPLQRIQVTPLQILSETQVNLFLPLTQRLWGDFNKPIRLDWHLYDAPTPQIYITQIHYPDALPTPSAMDPVESTVPLVTGLAAAEGHAIAPAYVLREAHDLPSEIPAGTVLVVPTISPDWLPFLRQAAALVAEQGGMTSHGALVARELGIPAVVNAPYATEQIQNGDWLLVDGTLGKVYSTLPGQAESTLSPMAASSFQRSPIATQLMVNLNQTDSIDRAVSLNTDGIGLLKAEVMILSILDRDHPQRWLQQNRQPELIDRLAEHIQQFVEAFAPNPVFYRSLDLRSHEFRSLNGAEEIPLEPNPMLGRRGTLSYLQNPALFDIELTALNQVMSAGYSNLRLILPFVRTVEEFQFCQCRIEQTGLTQHPNFQVWIMAEVPSVLFLLPDYVKSGVQGICIGTNDLTQLMLGVDRDQGLMATTFNETHPAVVSAIAQLIQTANQLNIPCSISTQTRIEAEFLDCLIESGITAISVNPDVVESMYVAIARAEKRFLLKKARSQSVL